MPIWRSSTARSVASRRLRPSSAHLTRSFAVIFPQDAIGILSRRLDVLGRASRAHRPTSWGTVGGGMDLVRLAPSAPRRARGLCLGRRIA